jgi:putative heme utilization carrier protein HutX
MNLAMTQAATFTRSSASDLETFMAGNAGAVIEEVAKQHGVTPREVVAALPAGMRRFAPGNHFAEVMTTISQWGDVTLIVNTDDGIIEFTGPVAEGKVSGDYYNVMARTGFHGHLRHQRCASIAFVQRPFMGRPSAFVAFLNTDGGIMFKIFVGRDEKRELLPAQLKSFEALADKFCAP